MPQLLSEDGGPQDSARIALRTARFFFFCRAACSFQGCKLIIFAGGSFGGRIWNDVRSYLFRERHALFARISGFDVLLGIRGGINATVDSVVV